MEKLGLLDLLNRYSTIHTLSYSTLGDELIDFLEIISEENQFIKNIDLGVLFINEQTSQQVTIVDGLNRLLSLSLLLHAICECYKKTSTKNENAIKTIRTKYLINGIDTKIKLEEKSHRIFYKIIFGEKLSGKEKATPMFQLLHRLWTRIKEYKLQAGDMFDMLSKIVISAVEVEDINKRNLYYTLNKDNRSLDQLKLIENYLECFSLSKEWNIFKRIFRSRNADIILFFKDYFITKFNFTNFEEKNLYNYFINYFDTMLQYIDGKDLLNKIIKSAQLYVNIINVNIESEALKSLLIKIKMHNGEDTYAYILNVYEDFVDNNLSETTFIEILSTIDEYLKNRLNTPNNVTFNELIKYLNTFITCK